MVTLALIALLNQVKAAPPIPVGTSPQFQQLYSSVADLLENGEFDKAATLASKLPSYTIKFAWDDQGALPDYRKTFRSAFDDAVTAWKSRIPQLSFAEAKNADLKISCSADLPIDPDSGMKKAGVFFFSQDPSEPRLESVFGTIRNSPETKPIPAIGPNIQILGEYTIGLALGVADSPMFGWSNYYTDLPTTHMPFVHGETIIIAQNAIEASDVLRKAAANHQKVHLGRPSVSFDRLQFVGDPVEEGAVYRFFVVVANNGDAPLSLNVLPDCSCFDIINPPTVKPGGSVLMQVQSRTRGFEGPIHKSLRIYTNDPDHAVTPFDVKGFSLPKVVIAPEFGNNSVEMTPKGATASFLVFSPSDAKFELTHAQVAGTPATTEIQPWTGIAGDTSIQIPKQNHSGYRVTVNIKPFDTFGRKNLSLQLVTSSKTLTVPTYNFSVTNGFSVYPVDAYFGRISNMARSLDVQIERGDHPFQITSVSPSSKFLKAVATKISDRKWKVTIVFDGKADFGPFNAEVEVHTNDPKEPIITIPVSAFVS